MNILAVDTTEEALSLALRAGERVLGSRGDGKRPHDQALLPAVDRLLAKAGLRLSDLDAIAVASGPGRFTGIRIGMAFAAVAASRLKIPALALSRLEALAFKTPGERVAAAVPGWKEERALQLFLRRGGTLKAEGEPRLVPAEGWRREAEALSRQGRLVAEERPSADDLLGPAAELLRRRRVPRFEPLYLKPAGYEVKGPPRLVR